MSLLTQAFVIDAIEAEKQGKNFSIDFDNVWENIGYSRKDNAVRKLRNDLDSEYYTLLKIEASYQSPERIKYYLSVDGFKHFCLMAKTPQGKETRNYFIEVEKIYRQNLERQFLLPSKQEEEIENLKMLVQIHLTESKQLAEALVRAEGRIEELTDLVSQYGLKTDKSCFDFDLDFLWDITGIASRSYLISIVLDNFKMGLDFITTPDLRPGKGNLPRTKYWLTQECHDLLVIALRSVRGVATENLPEILQINCENFFRDTPAKKGNSRFGKKRLK